MPPFILPSPSPQRLFFNPPSYILESTPLFLTTKFHPLSLLLTKPGGEERGALHPPSPFVSLLASDLSPLSPFLAAPHSCIPATNPTTLTFHLSLFPPLSCKYLPSFLYLYLLSTPLPPLFRSTVYPTLLPHNHPLKLLVSFPCTPTHKGPPSIYLLPIPFLQIPPCLLTTPFLLQCTPLSYPRNQPLSPHNQTPQPPPS